MMPCGVAALLWLLFSSWCLITTNAAVTSTITSSQDCYSVDESIALLFNTTNPLAGDLVGIVRSGTSLVVAAVTTCTRTPCTSPPASGARTIRKSLALGAYSAVLVRSNKQTVLASSALFRLQDTCAPSVAPSMSQMPTGATTTIQPSLLLPTFSPSLTPTISPSKMPTRKPTGRPTKPPTRPPTPRPSPAPRPIPTTAPSKLSGRPTKQPTSQPTPRPSPPPTVRPTSRPTSPPSKTPAGKPASLPTTLLTKLPTQLPTLAATPTGPETAYAALNGARAIIVDMIQANSRLTPEFLRMGFHDCVTVCDGCIDLTDPDHKGLLHPISALEPVVQQFATNSSGISRADIWALAVTVAADVADHGDITNPINFTMPWYGRVDCEDANTVCRDKFGAVTPCSATFGPSRNMASPNLNSDTVFSYFAKEFGFDKRQTVAIMGVHTVGHMVPTESGIDGPNGWTFNNEKLHNEYYQALVGQADSNTPQSLITAASPKWSRKHTNNSGTGFPDRYTWALVLGGKPLVMLNSDISLVREINATNQDPTTGEVLCAYNERSANGASVCPVASTVYIATEFADDNDLWLGEFKSALDLMLTNGYKRTTNCAAAACQLKVSSSSSRR